MNWYWGMYEKMRYRMYPTMELHFGLNFQRLQGRKQNIVIILYSRKDLFLLEGGEFLLQYLRVNAVIFQFLQKLRIFEPGKFILVFLHAVIEHGNKHSVRGAI